MPCASSFFSPALARKALGRYAPLTAAITAAWLFELPVSLSTALRGGADAEWLLRYFARNGQMLMAIQLMLIAGFVAMAVWSYLFSPRASLFFHALPVRREGLFFTHLVSGYAMLAVSLCFAAGCSALLLLAFGFGSVLPVVLGWLLTALLQALFFFGLASLCAFLTGHAVVMPLLYLIVNFAVAVLEYLLRAAFASFQFGLTGIETLRLQWLSPVVWLMSHDVFVGVRPGPAVWLLGLIGLVLTGCALLLCRKRHSERAGDVIAVPFLQPVFRWVFSVGCAIVLGSAVYFVFFGGSRLSYILCLLGAGAAGYLGAEMMLRKSLRVPRRSLLAMAGPLALVLLLALLLACDLLGLTRWVPAQEEVRAVYLNDTELTEAGDIARARTLHERLIALGEDSYGSFGLYFRYRLADGSEVTRYYSLPASDDDGAGEDTALGLALALLDGPGAVQRALPSEGAAVFAISVEQEWMDYRADVDPADFPALLDAVRADLEAGTVGRYRSDWEASSDNVGTELWLTIEYVLAGTRDTDALRYLIGEDDQSLMAVLREKGYWE